MESPAFIRKTVTAAACALMFVTGALVWTPLGRAQDDDPQPGADAAHSAPAVRGAILPVFPSEGIQVRTGRADAWLKIWLPDDILIMPADWGPDGSATYRSFDTDFAVTPLLDGGEYLTIVKKNPTDSLDYSFQLALPEGMQWVRKDGTILLVESAGGSPGEPGPLVGIFTSPTMTNSEGIEIPVTVRVTDDGDVRLTAQSPALVNTPVEIGFSYHPVDAVAAGD